MEFLFDYNRDQALLSMVIQEACKIAEKKGGYAERTALQKIIYFLKVLNVPMKYKFHIHHYGPYCDDIIYDTEKLIIDNIIFDDSNNPDKYSNFKPSTSIESFLKQYGGELHYYKKIIQKIAEIFIPLDPKELELITTLDYAYRWIRATGQNGPYREKVITRFKSLKRQKFTDDEINAMYNIIVKARIVEE